MRFFPAAGLFESMNYDGLSDFIATLKKHNELLEVQAHVSPELEITEIADRFSKSKDGGKALIFQHNGTDFPLLINAYGSNKRINLALNTPNSDAFKKRIERILGDLNPQPGSSWIQKLKMLPKIIGIGRFMPRYLKGKGKCQQVIHSNPDLNILPVMKCWPHDGGKFITLPIVHTKDPETGTPNIGMYRMQQISSTTTGMHWHKHKVGARHYNLYKARKEKMPVSVVLGGDPAYTYAATAPAPDQFDEYILAGFIRQKPVELVKCLTNDITVPADADIVIEGYIDPEESLIREGPFGDHTGFYSLADDYPLFHVTCITHRKDAVYSSTIVGVPPMEDAMMGEISEKLFLKPLQMGVAPDVTDMHMPVAGVVHNLVIVAADIQYQGQAFKIANALWGAGQMMFTKYIVVVDHYVDIRNYEKVADTVMKNTDFQYDILKSRGPLDVLDHASHKQSVGGKICIDATTKDYTMNKHGIECIDGLKSKILNPGIVVFYNADFECSRDKITEKYKNNRGVVILVEPELEELNSFTLIWYVLGNTDPERDITIEGQLFIVDGMRKHQRKDFKRPWPDLVIMEQSIIDKVNERWNNYEIGGYLPSPSVVLHKVSKGRGAEL